MNMKQMAKVVTVVLKSGKPHQHKSATKRNISKTIFAKLRTFKAEVSNFRF